MFEPRLEGGEGLSQAGKSTPGRRNREDEGPEAAVCLAGLGTIKVASGAGAE